MIRKLLITLTVMLGTIGVGWALVKAADTALELRTTTVANMPEMRAERAIVADWSGFTENVTANGSVYTITTPGQLAWIAAQVNQEPSNSFTGKTVKLGADIDLAGHNWNPIGKDKKHPFLGTFDGGNKSIKNMIVNIDVHAQENVFAYGGLFGIVKGEAAIKNVSIVSGRVTVKADKEAYAGALIAFTMDETNPFKGNISNCHSSIPVSSEITTTTTGYSNAFAGGLVGNLGNDAKGNNSTYLATVTNCSTSGSVTAKAGLVATNGVLAGGIAGRMQSSNILNCNTSGAIMSEGGSTPHAGGLVGHVSYTSTIKNCYSTSNVSSTSMNTSDAYSIVGGISGTLSKDSKVENCYATGALSAGLPATIGIWTISQVWAGGIVGYTMNTGSGISNCAALNASITISGNAAIQETAKSACRILGQNDGQSSLSGNLAYIGTTVTKWGVIMPPASTATSTDGATLKQSDLATLFTSSNGWTSTETNLPTLTKNGTQTNIPLSGYSFNTAKNGGELEALLADALIGEIKLIAGTYTGNFIMKDGVNVTGAVDNAGKPASILDGDAKGRVLSYGADLKYDGTKIAGTAFTKETAISNLVIRNGATADGASGAMICDKITLTNCEITGNKAPASSTSKGGGVMCDYGGVIDKCIIHDNTATDGGGGVVLNGGGLIRNSDVYANHADNDHSGGINTRKGGTIENCKVYGNTAKGLAGVSLNENAKMVNTLVYGNITGATTTDAYKSAVGMASSATMLNCTVWGNTHTNTHTGGQAVSTAGTITNCIMESHSGTGTITYSASGSELTTEKTGNLSKADPKFTDAAKNDYTLLPASACINKGTNEGVTAKTDLAGNTRIQGGTVDMGAYESNAAILPNNGIVYVTEKGDGLNNGNSLANAISPALLASAIANTNVTTLQFAAGTYALSDTIVVARATKLTFAAAKGADGKYATGVTLQPATDYAGRAIRVAQGANLQIDGLTISDFKTAASGSGIYNDGTLVLNEVTMSGNESDKDKVEPVYGAAIFNRANLTVNGGTFSANKTPNLIYNDSAQPGVRSLTIKGCRFFDNTAEYMVYSEGASTEITHCVFDGNKRTGASPAGNSGLIKVGRSVASGTDFPVTNTPAVLTSNTFISAGATTGTHNPAVLNDNGNITLTKNIFVNASKDWVALANTTTGTDITRTWRGAMNVFGKVDDPIKTSFSNVTNKNVFDKTIANVAFEGQASKKYNLGSGSVAIIGTDYAGAFAPLAGGEVVATGTIYLSANGAGTKDGSSEANAAPLTKFKTAADKTAVTKIILMENIALTSAELAIARTSGSLTIEAAKPEITVTAAAGQSAFTISKESMVTMKGFTIAGAIKSDGQLTLTDCTFDGNYASEVITLGGASSSIERCIFKGTNNSSTSIISITGAGARITNSLFYGFGARSLATLGADATLTNNTFVTADDVNAIVVTAGTATVDNNILIKGGGDKATISVTAPGTATVKN
ncbi:MAG: right-handed parallel beta-helix repeat-containing protein, partial [Tannerellaceae bacterium]